MSRPIRRMKALAVCVAAAIGMLMSGAPARAQKPLETLRIMMLNPILGTDYPDLIADSRGIFAAHRIRAEFVQSVNPIVPLLSGDVDIVDVGSAAAMNVVIKQQDFLFVGILSPPSGMAIMVRPDSPFAKLAHKWPESFTQLRGKTLGVTVSGAQLDLTAHWLAKLAGMNPGTDINIQAAGDASTLAASLSRADGSYDAAIVPDPLFELLEQRGVAVSILDLYRNEGPKQLADLPYATIGARKSFVEKHTDLIKNYRAAIQEAIDFARKPENRAAITAIVAKAVNAAPDTLQRPMAIFVDAIGSTKFSRRQWDTLIGMMTVNNMIKQTYNYEDYVFSDARAE